MDGFQTKWVYNARHKKYGAQQKRPNIDGLVLKRKYNAHNKNYRRKRKSELPQLFNRAQIPSSNLCLF